MATMIRANDQGHVALGPTYSMTLFSLYRDREGVFHLRPLEEPETVTPSHQEHP